MKMEEYLVCREVQKKWERFSRRTIILKSHTYNFVHFNIAKFLRREFVEDVDFDYLVLENSSGTIKPLPRYFREDM